MITAWFEENRKHIGTFRIYNFAHVDKAWLFIPQRPFNFGSPIPQELYHPLPTLFPENFIPIFGNNLRQDVFFRFSDEPLAASIKFFSPVWHRFMAYNKIQQPDKWFALPIGALSEQHRCVWLLKVAFLVIAPYHAKDSLFLACTNLDTITFIELSDLFVPEHKGIIPVFTNPAFALLSAYDPLARSRYIIFMAQLPINTEIRALPNVDILISHVPEFALDQIYAVSLITLCLLVLFPNLVYLAN